MISVRVFTTDLAALVDPQLIARAEAEMIESGIDILEPLARGEAPTRSGRGRAQIQGVVERRGVHPIGRVHAGKAFYLRILATGAKPHDVVPFRFKAKRRAGLARRAQGPGRARGAISALRFRLGGSLFFRGRVRHPGLKPDAWMERAARAGESRVGQAAEAVIERALDRATRG